MVTGASSPYQTTTYAYNAIPTSIPKSSPLPTGNGRLYTVDGPLTDDTITYTYDALGRMHSRDVHGATETLTYDNLSRVTARVNPMGTFGYVFNTPTGRLDE